MKTKTAFAKVRETCRCGAVLEYEGKYPRDAVRSFRWDHRICRENRWPWELTAAGAQSDGST